MDCQSDKNDSSCVPEVYSPIAIPLSRDFSCIHGPYDEYNEETKHLFVGREHITENLAALLADKKRKKGSYLISGYRGVGKTSIVNYAVKKFKEKNRKTNILDVHLNLGDKNQLTPLDIYHSIASILRKKIDRAHKPKTWFSQFVLGLQKIILVLLFALFVAVLVKEETHLLDNEVLISLTKFIAIILFIYALPIMFLTKEQKRLRSLLERITSEVSEDESIGLSRHININFVRRKKTLPVNLREVEEELSWIIGELEKKNYKVIIVLDELDKLSEEREVPELRSSKQPDSPNAVKVDPINDLLSALKSFITTTHATFFFIAGRETLDKYYSEKGSPNSLYESLFDRVFEVPSLLTDWVNTPKDKQITELIEEYVCRRLLNNSNILETTEAIEETLESSSPAISSTNCRISSIKKDINCKKRCGSFTKVQERLNTKLAGITNSTKNSCCIGILSSSVAKETVVLVHEFYDFYKSYYYSLEHYQRKLYERYENHNEDEEKIKKCKLIRRHISTLRDFIYYLTFHSWGNPKRLSSLFETFIVPAKQASLVDKAANNFKAIQNVEEPDSDFWLVFNINHLRNFSLVAELTGLFMHQLSREVSNISDKLMVSTFSAIHFILKFHSHGFRRSSLQRMSEAIGMYRSPEFNTIVNDLLAHTFNPYIRVVRNGIYRYRFYLGVEQEFHYISHVSDLESVTYNSSLDSMRYVKQFYKNIIDTCENQETSVRSGVHIALGDICTIEQSYADATIHYSLATTILLDLLEKNTSTANHNILLQCIEALLKQGDLEEHKQNFNNAAAIYLEAERIVERLCDRDELLKENLKNGNSKWILLKQPFWAGHFLSLKRSAYSFDHNSKNSPEFTIPHYLYSDNDQNFYHTAASLYFFGGYVELADEYYEKTISSIDENKISQDDYDERVAFLKGNSLIGQEENSLLLKSREFFFILKQGIEQNKNIYFINLFKFIEKKLINSKFDTDIFSKNAKRFEDNGLYVSAVITNIKAISYYTAILDAFCCEELTDNHGRVYDPKHLIGAYRTNISEKGMHAIKCINKARRLDSGHNNRRLILSNLEDNDSNSISITKLFELLLMCFKNNFPSKEELNDYPSDEELFWQHSLWAQKLASILVWAHYVERKITGDKVNSIFNKFPRQLNSLATRPAISIWWVQARWLSQKCISKKLLKGKGGTGEPASAIKILMNHEYPYNNVELTEDSKEFIKDLFLYLDNPASLGSECHILKIAYHISRNLYFAHAHSRIISRKNFDLIFPRFPQIIYVQWKLLFDLITTMCVGYKEEIEMGDRQIKLKSIKDFSYLLQRRLVAIDELKAPHERIPASHFDYEFIHLRLSESLDSSINLINNTSNTHKAIFQNKYFCHDDYGDPEFHTDYMLASMFTPSALLYQEIVNNAHEKLCKAISTSVT